MAAASLLPPMLLTPPRSEMPPILPAPPRSKMLPLLPTPSGLTLLLAVSTMPGRADFVQRWDAYKIPCISALSSSSASDNGGSSSRADAVERWDAHKKYKVPSSDTSSGAVERWDSKKLTGMSHPTDRGRPAGNTKRPASRASSAERWDLHKKPRPEEKADKLPQAGKMTAEATVVTTTAVHKEMTSMQQAAFAGPNFYASPDPSMLPMPSFLLRAH